MSRIRTIKPEFFKHEELFDAEVETGLPLRVAFSGLWTKCDRKGRFEWRPRSLKSDVLPYDEVDFSRVLDALATRGFVVKYTVGTREYGFVPSWERHQAINNREKASEIPEPPQDTELEGETTRGPRVLDASATREGSAPAEGEGEGEQDTLAIASDGDAVDARVEAVWKRGVPFLVERGVPEREARSCLGKWLRDHGGDAVFLALSEAKKSPTGDPIPYITEILKPNPDVNELVANSVKRMPNA